jgi:hypothetical protein
LQNCTAQIQLKQKEHKERLLQNCTAQIQWLQKKNIKKDSCNTEK